MPIARLISQFGDPLWAGCPRLLQTMFLFGSITMKNYKGSADHDTIFRAAGGRWRQPGGRLVRVWQTGEVRRVELGKRDAAHGCDAVRAEKWLWL